MKPNRYGQQNNILIIGCDYPTFQIYNRIFANNPDYKVMGFIHVPIKSENDTVMDSQLTLYDDSDIPTYMSKTDPPIHLFKTKNRINITVFAFKKLEQMINDKKIGKCFILCQNIPMKILQGIVHRIISTGQCAVEFIQPKVANIAAFKPVICVTAISKGIGKTQVCRHCCARLTTENRKVAIIMPMVNLDQHLLRLEKFSRENNQQSDSHSSGRNLAQSRKSHSMAIYHLEPSQSDSFFSQSSQLNENLPILETQSAENSLLKKLNYMDISLEVDEKSPHFAFTSYSEAEKYRHLFSHDTLWVIENYFKVGAFSVYCTTDIKRAIIQAEQCADVIIYDSFHCEIPYIKTAHSICVASIESINQLATSTLWPGLVNFLNCNNVAVITNGQLPLSNEQKYYITKLVLNQRPASQVPNTKSLFFLNSIHLVNDSAGMEIFNKKVLAIRHQPLSNDSESVAFSMGASEVIDPPQFLEKETEKTQDIDSIVAEIPHALSPTPETEERTSKAVEKIAQIINKSDAEVIIASIHADIPGIDPYKKILYASPEIMDNEGSIENWLSQFYLSALKPPLQAHFKAQVDILMSLADATDKELSVTNNQSANRESLCQLFLTSHLPPGFRATNGEVVDAHGNHTGRADVVIVNETAPYLTIDGSNSVITPILADYVLAVVEVKSNLTSESLKKALSQLRPVKSLMPMHETLKMPNGQIIPDPLGGKIITGVFSFTSGNDVDNKIVDILKLYPNVADFIVLPDSFAYVHAETLRVSGFNISENVVNGYVRYSARGMGLAIVFGILNSIAGKRRFNGSNCVKYLSGFWGDRLQQDFELAKRTYERNNMIQQIRDDDDDYSDDSF